MQISEEKEMTIEEFFKMSSEDGGEYQIDTPDGWSDIGFLVKKKDRKCYNFVLFDGTELGCSESHKILTHLGWKEAKDIDPELDVIATRSGPMPIDAKESIGVEDTFDLNVVNDEHQYYSNNVVSHNCGKSLTAKATSSLFGLPLLRLDFGKLFSSFVGSSEETTRSAIKLAETLAPCITGDTCIKLSDGSHIKAEELWNSDELHTENDNEDIEIKNSSEMELKLVSYNCGSGAEEPIRMNYLIKRKNNKKVFKISTDNGKSIKVTEDHKLLIINGDKKIWKKAKDLKLGDKVVTLKNMENKMSKIISIEEVDDVEYVYDPCCDEPNNYVANGFVNHNCILWIDEVEKGLSGSKSSGQTDGGTTSRVIATFLTWMEEKEASVFMFCTANDHSQIPPEFMRRFDEVFFVDLPSLEERTQIYEVLLKKYGRDYDKFNIDLLALSKKSENYSGSEIEKSIVEALHVCYNEGCRDITTKDILNALSQFNPLYKIREEDFSDMRAWAKDTCRMANSKKKVNVAKSSDLELDLS